MADKLKIKNGTKLQMAFDVPMGQEPSFNMICTFSKSIDESAFLISIPMVNNQALPINESQKLLIRYGSGADAMILAGYADDVVKDGIRRYWKIRRVSEQRQFFQRTDERLKVTIRIQYKQETWDANDEGVIPKEDGMTLDISAGGAALYMNRRFDVGEICEITLPRIGTSESGKSIEDVTSVICWVREAPKGSLYKFITGVQYRFPEPEEKQKMQGYCENVKDKYKL